MESKRTKKERTDGKTESMKCGMGMIIFAGYNKWNVGRMKWTAEHHQEIPHETKSRLHCFEQRVKFILVDLHVNEAVQEQDTSGQPYNESSMIYTAHFCSNAVWLTGKNENIGDDQEKPGTYSTVNDGEGRRRVGYAEDARHQTRTTEDEPAAMQMVRIDTSEMVLEKDCCVTTKGE